VSIVTQLLAHLGRTRNSFDLVSLNPQPLPPRWLEGLNPQPIPPGEYGAAVGRRVLELAWISDRLGVPVVSVQDDIDEFCPMPFVKIPLPPGFGFPPVPDPEPGPDWRRAYLVGLASTLAATSGRVAESELVRGLLDRSLESFAAIEG